MYVVKLCDDVWMICVSLARGGGGGGGETHQYIQVERWVTCKSLYTSNVWLPMEKAKEVMHDNCYHSRYHENVWTGSTNRLSNATTVMKTYALSIDLAETDRAVLTWGRCRADRDPFRRLLSRAIHRGSPENSRVWTANVQDDKWLNVLATVSSGRPCFRSIRTVWAFLRSPLEIARRRELSRHTDGDCYPLSRLFSVQGLLLPMRYLSMSIGKLCQKT